MTTALTQQPKPKLKIVPKIAPKTIALELEPELLNKAPLTLTIKPLIKIKPAPAPAPKALSPQPSHASKDEDSSTMELSVDDASTTSTISADTTYVMPVYGINMRVSLDNKHIYDMDFNLVGNVLDDKSIEWIEEEDN